MPQILFLLAAGAGMILASKLLGRASGRVDEDLRQAREAMDRKEQSRDRTTATPLERDPATGIYRPKQPDIS